MPKYKLAKKILSCLPSVTLRAQSEDEWSGAYPLPTDVAEYYCELGPVDVWIEDYGNPHFLPSLARLWGHQVGYRTHGFTHARLLNWEDDSLVIADQGGDPFIYSRSSGRILHADHGVGRWEPVEMFASLPEMVTTLAILGGIVKSAGSDFTDEDSLIRRPHQKQAQDRIAASLESRERGHAIVARLGWGEN